MGDDESKFRDAVRGLAEAQQVAVEKQLSPRDKLLEMTGVDEQDVETLRAENTQLKTELAAHQEEIATNRQELTAKDKELAVNQQELAAHQMEIAANQKELAAHQEEIALLKAQLQKLQPPKEGVPPV